MKQMNDWIGVTTCRLTKNFFFYVNGPQWSKGDTRNGLID